MLAFQVSRSLNANQLNILSQLKHLCVLANLIVGIFGAIKCHTKNVISYFVRHGCTSLFHCCSTSESEHCVPYGPKPTLSRS